MRARTITMLRACCIATLLHLLPAPALAEVVRLVTGNYPPYEYEANGQVQGVAVELIRSAYARSNWQVDIQVVPWARALRDVQNGDADGVFATARTQERDAQFFFSRESIIPFTTTLFVHIDNGWRFDGDLLSLADLRIGLLNQASNGPAFNLLMAQGKLHNAEMANDTLTNVRKLLSWRIDVMVANRYNAIYVMKQNNLYGQVLPLKPDIDTSPTYLAFSRKRDLSRAQSVFDAGIAAMKKDGSYQQILERYGF
ncbi:substrate-binding periplasmic protein [Andreprevotia lacus]|nr:transporter substrate-binding domain-containing protein [Andreprevotia lacus]